MITLGPGYYSISGRGIVVGEGLVVSFGSNRTVVTYDSKEAFEVDFPPVDEEEVVD